jgi:hypothetical protein
MNMNCTHLELVVSRILERVDLQLMEGQFRSDLHEDDIWQDALLSIQSATECNECSLHDLGE